MIDVTCAVIRNDEQEVLIVQRGEKSDHPYKWEFPGGKLNPGENEEDCVIREVKEELSMDIVICRRLKGVEYDYGIKKIRLIPFICDSLDDIPFLSEHIAWKWVNVRDLMKNDFSEADVFVAEEYIMAVCGDKKEKENKPQNTELPADEDISGLISSIMGMKEAEWTAQSLIDNPALLKKIVELSGSGDQKLASHASWILTKVGDKSPESLDPYLPLIIESLPALANEGTLRSFLRILSFTDPAKYSTSHQGLLADTCFRILNSGLSAIAAKTYSMEILYRLTLIYPELATELALSVSALVDTDSAAIKSRGKAILRKLS